VSAAVRRLGQLDQVGQVGQLDAGDRRAAIVLLTAAIALTVNNFAADDARWLVSTLDSVGFDEWARRLHAAMTTSPSAAGNDLTFWAVVQITSYVVPAALVIRFVFRERFAAFGVRIRGTARYSPVYVGLYAVALPALVLVSTTHEFQTRYPFLRITEADALRPLFVWWSLYALQFCALEFFFRGFMVHGLAPRFGTAAVFVMALPYNMLHYGKPMLEALAAIVGAVVLGILALRSRTIWWGAALHIAVAGTMDLLSLWHRGVV
jgi:membrane protease YdiL (CAAX protease family)